MSGTPHFQQHILCTYVTGFAKIVTIAEICLYCGYSMKGYRRFQCSPQLSLWSSATVPVSVTLDIPGGIKQIFVHVKPAIGLLYL